MNQPLFYGNLLVTLAFGAFAGLMFYRLANTKGKIKYAGRQWDATKITLIVIVGLTLVSLIGNTITVFDILRVIVIIVAIVAYWLAKGWYWGRGLCNQWQIPCMEGTQWL